MTARRPSLRIHVEITVLTCPLHCIAGIADEQAPRGVVPKVAGSRIDQSGKALLRHRGAFIGPVTHEPSKNTPVVPSTMIPCNDLIASSPTKHTTHTHTHMLINTLIGGMVLGDMLRCSCCHHVTPTSSGTCRTSAPPHRLATRTLPGPLHSRRVAPSTATDSGHWTLDDGP